LLLSIQITKIGFSPRGLPKVALEHHNRASLSPDDQENPTCPPSSEGQLDYNAKHTAPPWDDPHQC
jgi:hypothetical protein